MTQEGARLRKTTTLDAQWAVATYEVQVGGEVLGTVTKYDMPGTRRGATFRGGDNVPGRVVRWSADITGTEHDELQERRKDAVNLLLHVHERKAEW